MIRSLKKIKQTLTTSTIAPFYFLYKLKQKKAKPGKLIFISLLSNPYGRYLYLLIKFFHIEGYTIYLHGPLKLFYDINKDPHAAHIMREKLIQIGTRPKQASIKLMLDEANLSADYFSFINNNGHYQQSFYVPMSQHPLMYHFGWWNKNLEKVKRKRSLFMAGNFSETQYNRIENETLFGVLTRAKIYACLNNKNLLFPVDNLDDLKQFLKSDTDNKILLVNSLTGGVPMDLLRDGLNSFDFFFAMPGVVMPFSHNIVEAMSAGCIPFIQEHYANLFYPPLQNAVQSITFTGFDNLEEKIKYLFTLPEDEIEFMRNNVIDYYNNFLMPKNVVDRMVNKNFEKIYLQAEGASVAILKKSLAGSTAHL